jgi:hypothetical protein
VSGYQEAAQTGILLLGRDASDAVIESRARRAGLALQHGDKPAVPFERTLVTVPGARVPFELLPAGFGLLEKWDAAVPLWQYTVTAESVGTPAERERTRAVIHDLRVLLHAVELLFVRDNEPGRALLAAWANECAAGGERRLAFLRATYTVKPRLCVLPTSWLVDVRQAQKAAAGRRGVVSPKSTPLVRLELAPGRFVKVHAGDEEKARAHFARQKEHR